MIVTEQELLDRIITQSLDEDLDRAGDITSNALFSDDDTASAIIRSKKKGILSGCEVIIPIFYHCNHRCLVDVPLKNGAHLEPGTIIASISGPVRGILAGERLCLNFLQHLSGIATLTAQYASAIAHTTTRLLDTRKTSPGLRFLEKAAVRHGTGCNHRFGLFDMMLIKDTHVKHAGGIIPALERAFAYRASSTISSTIKIEIEVQSFTEFSDALARNPDRIMLDNMSLDTIHACVLLRNKMRSNCELEASGNVTLTTIAPIAETGVDFISVGSLTHSAPALDIHLVIQ